jgi:hypothetical protein
LHFGLAEALIHFGGHTRDLDNGTLVQIGGPTITPGGTTPVPPTPQPPPRYPIERVDVRRTPIRLPL